MSDQFDRDDDPSSDVTSTSVEQESSESESDREGKFLDLEAEESDGYEDEDEDEAHDDDDRYSGHHSFLQFSRLPPELRTMVWEAVDPDLKSEARVLDLQIVRNSRGGADFDIWESAPLAQQTAPTRALLSICGESRRIALGHYPDTIRLRCGRGEVRFNSANDIILLRLPHGLLGSDIHGLGRWCDRIKYLALDFGGELYPTPRHLPALDPPPQGLEAIFYCFEATVLGYRALDWSVSESSKRYYIESSGEWPGLDEDFKTLYCWPDTTLHADFLDQVGFDYMMNFPEMSAIGSIPVWPMAQYFSDRGLALYQKAKRYYEWTKSRENGSASPFESSEGESFYESDPDDYERDGFVIDSSSEESEEASDDEDEGVSINAPHSLSSHEDSSEGGEYEEGARVNEDLDDFHGFSPIQGSSDDEITGNSVNVISTVHSVEPDEDQVSDAPSFEEQLPVEKRPTRRKRHIVSSDDEPDCDDDVASTGQTHTQRTKRARFAVSDSEDDEGGAKNGAEAEVEESSRLRKRARVILSDSEDGEDESDTHSEGHRLPKRDTDEEAEEGEEDHEETAEESEEDEEKPSDSKPMSLFAKLRQFRSEVPVSPGGESLNSGEDYNEEEYGDEERRGFSDAEFPESAEEDGDQEGW